MAELQYSRSSPIPASPRPSWGGRRDHLPFPGQLLIWSWRILGRAYPDFGNFAERVTRAYEVVGAPAAFPALYALVVMASSHSRPGSSGGGSMPCPNVLALTKTESRLLACMRHLQRGNDRLGQQALAQVIADWRLPLALHYARVYAAEMAVSGQWYFGVGETFRPTSRIRT